MDPFRSQNGFTLIEVAIGLALSLLLLSLSMNLQTMVTENIYVWKTKHQLQLEAAAFLHYLENELSGSEHTAVSSNRIMFVIGADQYDYRQTGNVIVRRKNFLGYVTACYYVKQWRCTPIDKGIQIELTLEKNKVIWVTKTVIAFHV